ncbi:MAG: SDR family oxidoreductase [Rhodospirillaceae bacterium]|nr:SDR family oxidoreductase [Rhodospirillaceae bacterium]
MSAISPRTVLITGAARRIGRALAEGLARDGWRVAVHVHGSTGDAESTVHAIRAHGGVAEVVEADLSDHRAVANLVPAAAAKLGPLGALINNASIFERDEIDTVTAATWNSHLDVNLKAPLFLCQSFARQLPAHGSGAIINIVDQRVWNLTPHFVSYTVSKAGLWTLTQTLALALAPRIRVNAIGPGPVLPSPRQNAEQFAAQARATPLGRGATPGEICDAARYILAAPAMTGQMIALDGGQHLGWGQVPRGAPVED